MHDRRDTHRLVLERRVSHDAGVVLMLRDLLLDALFPIACLGCAERLRGVETRLGRFCRRCRATTPAPPPPLCVSCGVPVPASVAATLTRSCAACRAHPPYFATARGAALYDPGCPSSVLVTVIHAFKYHGDRALAAALADLITMRLRIPEDVVVVPVPLHRSRLRVRGFNQAALIARAVARHAGRPFTGQALARRVPTSSQAVLGAAARRRNLHDAFVVMHPDAIRGRHVLVIDDVITTTATVDACAHALLGAGARRVDAYAAGRTPLFPSP